MIKICENCGIKYNDETVQLCPMCKDKIVEEYEKELKEVLRYKRLMEKYD